MKPISIILANLDRLKNKLDNQAPDVELYEQRERELLDLGIGLSSMQAHSLRLKINYDKEYTMAYNAYKASKEKVTDAETKRAIDFQLLDKEVEYKEGEAVIVEIQKQYDAYRRFSENVLKSRMIREQADMRRAEMATKHNDINDIPF